MSWLPICMCATVVACALFPRPGAAPAARNPGGGQAPPFEWWRGADTVALVKDGRPVWQFNYSPALSKPCFHPLALPGGSDLTWLSPRDHPHHLALFFSWKYLNRVNYWEEPGGIPEGTTRWSNVEIETRADFAARIKLALQYRPRGATADVLNEKRALAISRPAGDGAYSLDWDMEFTAGPADVVLDRTPPDTTPDGNARGGYAGLSIRLAAGLSSPRVAATADTGPLAKDRYGFAASAAEFNGVIDGGEVGVAILDHPSNPRAPTRWYGIMARSVPFWYLNASLLQLEPYSLAAHQRMTLRYRIVVHPLRWSPSRLQEEHAGYARENARTK